MSDRTMNPGNTRRSSIAVQQPTIVATYSSKAIELQRRYRRLRLAKGCWASQRDLVPSTSVTNHSRRASGAINRRFVAKLANTISMSTCLIGMLCRAIRRICKGTRIVWMLEPQDLRATGFESNARALLAL